MGTPSKALTPEVYTCSFPGCPAPITIHISVIETLQGIVRDTSGNQQGILCGQPSAARTVVQSTRAATVLGPEEMRAAMAEAQDLVVGYYRIREGNSLELTADEVRLAETLFAKPGSVILLIERRAGCPEANFFFQDHGKFLNLPLLEFPLKSADLALREAHRVKGNEEDEAVPAAGLPADNSESHPPSSAPDGKSRSVRWPGLFLIFIVTALASLSTALLIYRLHNRIESGGAPKAMPLHDAAISLRAERQGEDLKIMWDLNSPAVTSATSGVVDIDDGGTTRRIPLTIAQVRFGSMLYSPVSEQVSLQLTTLKDNQNISQASVLVLLSKPPQSPVGLQTSRVPFEVQAVRKKGPGAIIPPAGKPETNSPVAVETLPATQANPEHVDGTASPASVSAPPPPEPAQTQQEGRSGTVLPPSPVITPGIEPAQTHPEGPVAGPISLPAAVASPRSEPAKVVKEEYVAPVLISQVGMRKPRELPAIVKPIAISVRVDVDEAGRVTRAEAIPEKGVHALLLRAATDAARLCRFQPGRHGQSPVASSVTIVFRIGPDQ